MLRIEVHTPVSDQADPIETAIREHHIKAADVHSAEIVHRSLDARAKRAPRYDWQIDLELENEAFYLKKLKARHTEPYHYQVPEAGSEVLETRPVIAGFGPAGMAAAYLLAAKGYRPIVVERGPAIEDRKAAVDSYWKTGVLDPERNVQFGEGGAGAFSDGKLTTRVKDPRVRLILTELVKAGADPSIIWMNHPHIGTDALCGIDENLRKAIERMGGEVRFMTKLEQIVTDHGSLKEVKLSNGSVLPCRMLILAIGHSARDTFRMLAECGVPMEAKQFAVGFRAEHLQSFINARQYRSIPEGTVLPAAEYHLSHTSSLGKGVYSFCMCPGGYVVAAASEKDTVVVNGMSYAARDGRNANSALVIQTDASDFGEGLMAGVEFQERMEHLAFEMGNGKAPCETIAHYLDPSAGNEISDVLPTYPLGVKMLDLHPLLNERMNQSLAEMLVHTEKIFPGFTKNGALFTGVETRTSSPVRILRNLSTMESEVAGLYPCGEGAGYSGGIVSSAIDGVKAAEQIIARFAPPEGLE
jgi:uncharacterized FAD-dependent dehydrogenase